MFFAELAMVCSNCLKGDCLSAAVQATLLKKVLNDCDDILCRWYSEDLSKLWWQSGSSEMSK